jgi:hypothetical protein
MSIACGQVANLKSIIRQFPKKPNPVLPVYVARAVPQWQDGAKFVVNPATTFVLESGSRQSGRFEAFRNAKKRAAMGQPVHG